MGKDFFHAFSIAKETFQEADDLLGENLTKVIFEGPMETLITTRYSQMAIFVTSMAIFRTLRKQFAHFVPAVCAGLSLGEYTALCASEKLSFCETLLLVKERARRMNEACEHVPGAMTAIVGLEAASIESLLKGLNGVWIANYNAPEQIVISGTKEGVERAAAVLKEKGAKRVLPLDVHGAFHSGLMQSAREGLAPVIERAPIIESPIAFVMNVPGDFVTTIAEMRRNLICQVTEPVRWEQGIEAMKAFGVDFYLEIGCGKTLTGLNRKMGVSALLAVEKVADLEGVYAHATA